MIIFEDKDHSYRYNGERYTSVTTKVASMEPHKDFGEIAEKYVRKHGREEILKRLAKSWKIKEREAIERWGHLEFTKESIMKIWKEKSDFALEVGSGYHKFKEDELLAKIGGRKVYESRMDNGIKKSFDLAQLKSGIYPELILYDHYHKIAGQSDIVCIDGKLVDIEDHKTSEEITTEGTAYFRPELGRKTVEMMRTPLAHLENINFNHYALQLSAYGYMLEKFGYKVRTLTINHVIFSDKALGIVKEVVPYKLPYLRREVEAMFKTK